MRILCLLIGISCLIAACGGGGAGNGNSQTPKTSASDSVSVVDSLDGTSNDFAFVAFNQFLILGDADSNWTDAEPTQAVGHDQDYYYTITTRLKNQKAAKYKELIGKTFRIYTEKGTSQLVQIESLKLLAVCGGSLVDVAYSADSTPVTNKEKAQYIWSISSFYVAATFKEVKGKQEFLFGVPSSKNEPKFYDKLSSETNADVLKMLINTNDYKKAQKKFHAIGEYPGNWWEQSDNGNFLENYKAPNGDLYTLASHTAGSPCGDESYTNRFSISLTKPGKSPQLVRMVEDNEYPIAVVDLNGDGSPEYILNEFMAGQFILTKTNKGWKKLYLFEIAIHECPC